MRFALPGGAWRFFKQSEAILSSLESQTALFSALDTLLQALDSQQLPLELQRSLSERALLALDVLIQHAREDAERRHIASYIARLATASEQWTFMTEAAAESFALAACPV